MSYNDCFGQRDCTNPFRQRAKRQHVDGNAEQLQQVVPNRADHNHLHVCAGALGKLSFSAIRPIYREAAPASGR